MGQILVPSSGGIAVVPTDRESGPGAGAGASGNRDIFLGALAGRNSAINDLIAIGNNAASGGMTNALDAGTTVIGSQSLKSLVNAAKPTNYTGPLTVVGFNNFPNPVNFLGSVVAVGSNIGANWPAVNTLDFSGFTLLGTDVLRYHSSDSTSYGANSGYTIIGAGACRGQSGWVAAGSGCSFASSVIIGDGACANSGNTGPTSTSALTLSVIIGSGAGANILNAIGGSCANNVFIGANCVGANTPASDNVVIGSGCGLAFSTRQNVLIGSSIAGNLAAAGGNVLVGSNINTGSGLGTRNIVLGFGNGATVPTSGNDYLSVGTFDGSTTRNVLWGNMATGNLISGNTSSAQRDTETIGSTNALKLVNGSRGAGNPNTGGFFYVVAGALHWVGSAGTDTTIAPA